MVIPLVVVVCLLFLFLWVRHRGTVMQGIVQFGPEQSAFFPDGDCSKTPFWFTAIDVRDYDAKLPALGYHEAIRVKFRGRVSPVGRYGHLGAYPREVQSIELISVESAPPCPWPGEHGRP